MVGMREDMDELAEQWRAATHGCDELRREAVTASRRHRLMSVLTWSWLAACLACGVLLLDRALDSGSPTTIGGAVAFILALSWMTLMYRRQQRMLADRLMGTPREAVESLIAHARAELYWWTGRGALVAGAVIVLAAACMVVPPWLASLGTTDGDAWQRFMVRWVGAAALWALLAIPFAAWRVRVLRARIAAWSTLSAELGEEQ